MKIGKNIFQSIGQEVYMYDYFYYVKIFAPGFANKAFVSTNTVSQCYIMLLSRYSYNLNFLDQISSIQV